MRRSMFLAGAVFVALAVPITWRAVAPAAPPDERRGERERERDRAREYEALEGTWRIIRYEQDGKLVDDGAKRAWIVKEHRWSHQENGETSPECRLEIEPSGDTRRLDVWEGDVHTISANYVRAGEYVILCANRLDQGAKGRPERFETGTPEGGAFLLVCKIQK